MVEEVEVVVPVDKAIAVVEEVLVHEMPCIVIRRLLILMCIVRTLSRMSCKGHLCCVFFIFLNFILFKILKKNEYKFSHSLTLGHCDIIIG